MDARVVLADVMLSLVFSASCSREPPTAPRQGRTLKKVHRFHEWTADGLTTYEKTEQVVPKAGYVFYRWRSEEKEGFAVLKDGYGMMIFHDAWQPVPIPRYELYPGDAGTIVRTRDPNEFLRELRRIPAGQILRFFRTCGSTCDGVDRNFPDTVRDLCREKRVILLDGGEELICTCL